MSGIFLHHRQLWSMAKISWDRAAQFSCDHPERQPSDALVAIILAAATAECFINELAELVRLDFEGNSRQFLSAGKLEFLKRFDLEEKGRGRILEKYCIAALTLSGKQLIKDKNPYQDFKLLVDVRNYIIHLRPRQRLVPDVGFPLPEAILGLEKRGLTFKPKWWRDYSWVDAISTVEMAEWSCQTARNMIIDIHNRLPPGKDSISYSILADGHLPM
jgi:hypothetical protein